MSPHREALSFAAVLAALVAAFFAESLFGGKILSPADVLRVSASFRDARGPSYEPANRLLMDPVLQFHPWLEFNRSMLRSGRLPLWNDRTGCGAPHLANGQSAVFDPFHLIAYVGPLPEAYSWMAAARLWVAGLGAFLLARSWGYGPWGRWFCGLTFPLCGFLVIWLLFPVTNVAVWLPWLLWASDRAMERPGTKSVSALALVVGCVLLGGHVQTSAHVLLASGAYAAWRIVRVHPRSTIRARTPDGDDSGRSVASDAFEYDSAASFGAREGVPEAKSSRVAATKAWCAGLILGALIGAAEIIPLGFYLAKSPVWADREREHGPWWTLRKPRVLDAACTALPYLYGSQRRGHPNLARALGVHNLNESAGGFAGLGTLLWLAPLAWQTRPRSSRTGFLLGLSLFGAFGAFGLPPVDQLLRALPILNVTDNRRLTLWVAFGLVFLGGAGMDALGLAVRERSRPWAIRTWLVAAIALFGLAALPRALEPTLHARSSSHYARAAALTPGANAAVYQERAERQVRQAVAFIPCYLTLAACHLVALAALRYSLRSGWIAAGPARASLLGLCVADLLAFGYGLNPAINRADERPSSPIIAYLQRELPAHGRVLGLGEELPPNTLMRYGLSDIRNYDSIELSRSLDWFAPLYEPGRAARTSRREVTWDRVARAADRLVAACVGAVVAASRPPDGLFARVDRVGDLWIARLDGLPFVSARSLALEVTHGPGRIDIKGTFTSDDRIIVRETYDSGWRGLLDGQQVAIEPEQGVFMAARVPRGSHRLVLRYDPLEVKAALAVSLTALAGAVFGLTGLRLLGSTRRDDRGLDGPMPPR